MLDMILLQPPKACGHKSDIEGNVCASWVLHYAALHGEWRAKEKGAAWEQALALYRCCLEEGQFAGNLLEQRFSVVLW